MDQFNASRNTFLSAAALSGLIMLVIGAATMLAEFTPAGLTVTLLATFQLGLTAWVAHRHPRARR